MKNWRNDMIRNANEQRKTALGKIEGNRSVHIWLKPFGTTTPIEFKSWAEVKAYEAKNE